MASAAQLAARKKFAAIMKSGGFGKKRKAPAKRKKNPTPVAALPAGTNPRRTLNKAPALRKAAPVKRMANPLAHRAPSGFAVHLVKHGDPAGLLGVFSTKALAVEYANGYANKHNRQVCIVGKR